uniref:cellulase n=1 Tax=Colletotrichum fructicola (strain Nara gc5) TaxID=1213859 RepID=L2G655_COLFN
MDRSNDLRLCVKQNDYYSQCVQGSAGAGAASAQQVTTLKTSTRRSCKSKTAGSAAASVVVPQAPTTSAAGISTTSAGAAVKPSAQPVDTKTAPSTSSKAASSQVPVKSVAAEAVSSSAPVASSAPAASASATPGKTGKFKWFGSNQSGAEFGQGTLPGTAGKDYTFPDTTKVDTLISQGYNTFRLNFLMERLAPNGLTGSFDADYLAGVVLDPHNYGRFNNNIITDTAAFKTFFTNWATLFKSNDKVIFDTNNEYNSMDQDLVLKLNQAAIDGIRASGATNYIWVEGNSWTGAHSWVSTNDNMKALTDPLNKIAYEMHQYLDSDSSGTSETCVSATIGVERVKDATEWLRSNGKVGVLGEFAGGANDVCKEAVTGLLDYLQQNSDVWIGATTWAAGPMWGSYMYSFEPETGVAYNYYNDLLKTYQ